MSRCIDCQKNFEPNGAEERHRQKLAPRIDGRMLSLPPPALCSPCRLRRRYAFRNDWRYYRRSCDRCRKNIVSVYTPETAFPVYCPECFWTDDWSELDSGCDIDWSRPFFEQFAELQRTVPRISIFRTHSENSDFSMHSSRNRSCYLVSSCHECVNVLFSDLCRNCVDSLDIYCSDVLELCYECHFCSRCYDAEFLEHCVELSESALCLDCRRGKHLIGCVGLRAISNAILNEPASPQECQEVRKRLLVDDVFAREFRAQYAELVASYSHPAQWYTNCEESSGNLLQNCFRAESCFNTRSLEDCIEITEASMSRDCACGARVSKCELLYECHGSVESTSSAFCNLIYNCSELIYCDNCQAGAKQSFGCISLKRESHCILNKRYSPKAYGETVTALAEMMVRTGEWGQFFPPSTAPFGYNETTAAIWFPSEAADAAARGWRWSHYEAPLNTSLELIPTARLPYSSLDVGDEILEHALECEVTKKPFRLTRAELDFYRRQSLPLPRRSPWCRQSDRVRRLERSSRPARCAVCSNAVTAFHPANAPYSIICESCYLDQTSGSR